MDTQAAFGTGCGGLSRGIRFSVLWLQLGEGWLWVDRIGLLLFCVLTRDEDGK